MLICHFDILFVQNNEILLYQLILNNIGYFLNFRNLYANFKTLIQRRKPLNYDHRQEWIHLCEISNFYHIWHFFNEWKKRYIYWSMNLHGESYMYSLAEWMTNVNYQFVPGEKNLAYHCFTYTSLIENNTRIILA